MRSRSSTPVRSRTGSSSTSRAAARRSSRRCWRPCPERLVLSEPLPVDGVLRARASVEERARWLRLVVGALGRPADTVARLRAQARRLGRVRSRRRPTRVSRHAVGLPTPRPARGAGLASATARRAHGPGRARAGAVRARPRDARRDAARGVHGARVRGDLPRCARASRRARALPRLSCAACGGARRDPRLVRARRRRRRAREDGRRDRNSTRRTLSFRSTPTWRRRCRR